MLKTIQTLCVHGISATLKTSENLSCSFLSHDLCQLVAVAVKSMSSIFRYQRLHHPWWMNRELPPSTSPFLSKARSPAGSFPLRVLAFCQRMTTQCSPPVSCTPLWLPNARRQDSPCSSPVLCSPLPRTRWQEADSTAGTL